MSNRIKMKSEIPAQDLNEWGHPDAPWFFVGFYDGQSHWRKDYDLQRQMDIDAATKEEEE